MDDRQLQILLGQLQQGNSDTLDALYRELNRPIYTVILRMTGNTALSEDILQEFFVKLYRNPPAAMPKKPRAYLFQMAHNLTVDHLRRERPTTSLSDCAETPQSPEFSLVERMDLERAMASLSPLDREIVTLHAGAGLTFREVAAVTALPLGTALWRYQRAIQRLRELLNGGML